MVRQAGQGRLAHPPPPRGFLDRAGSAVQEEGKQSRQHGGDLFALFPAARSTNVHGSSGRVICGFLITPKPPGSFFEAYALPRLRIPHE